MPFAPVTGGSSAGVLHAAGAQRGQLLASLLGSFLGQQQKDADKLKADTQKATTLRKAISLYAPEMKDSVGAMGLADLEGVVGSFTMKQQAAAGENAAADNRRADQFLKLQQDQFAAGQQQRDAQGRLSQNLARYAAAPADLGSQFATGTAGLDTPGGLTLDRYLAAAGEAGAPPDPRVLEQFIQNGQRGGNMVDPTPLPFSAGGVSGVYSPKTGQFQAERPEPSAKDARMTVVLERDDMDRPTRTWTGSPKQYEEQFGKPSAGAAGEGKPLTRELVADFLKQAGGDKNKARELARKAGYTF